MAYLALYRKYRPVTFDRVIGQEHIVKILKAQIKNGSIGHAYLFCGARGTGKTSVAKIFARAINCLNPVDGSPCNSCEVCGALSSGGNMDVLEIDAASNNKVEEVREIREKVQYPPVNGRYKVYIIDEVHMLTDSAFNALLKTLEEPPRHAVFILATTEVHKLPATILSRCMRFDFRLVSLDMISSLIKDILKETGKPYEEAAVTEIARAGEGSVRDALSVADMCISYSEGTLKYDDVLELLSASDRKKISCLADCMLSGDTGGMLKGIDSLASAGKSIAVLNRDIITYLRDMTIIKSCNDANGILMYPEDIFQIYSKNAEKYDIKKVLRALELLSGIETELKYSLHPRIIFEAAALRSADAGCGGDSESLAQRVSALEDIVKKLQAGAPVLKSAKENQASYGEPVPPLALEDEIMPPFDGRMPFEKESKQAQTQEIKKDAPKAEGACAMWGRIIRTLRQSNAGLLYTLCSELAVEIRGNDFIVYTDSDMAAEILNKPKNYDTLKSIINDKKEYNVIIRKGGKTAGSMEKDIETLRELSEGKLIIKD